MLFNCWWHSNHVVVCVYVCVQLSVGPDNVPGYDAVQNLAHYLVSLVGEASLTNGQVDTVVDLWSQLHNSDKQRVIYQQRYQSELTRGRFGRQKTTVTPGVESIKRYVTVSCIFKFTRVLCICVVY